MCFSLPDAHYLWLERRYRRLYDDVIRSEVEVDYSMGASKYKGLKGGYWGAFRSVTVAPFYFGLGAVILIVGLLLG